MFKSCNDYSHLSSQNEMVSSKVKEKEDKVVFLFKLISHVEKVLRVSINLKPSKIVAGLEADQTRHFLQLFVLAATSKRDDSMHDPLPEENTDPKIDETDNNLDSKEVEVGPTYIAEVKPASTVNGETKDRNVSPPPAIVEGNQSIRDGSPSHVQDELNNEDALTQMSRDGTESLPPKDLDQIDAPGANRSTGVPLSKDSNDLTKEQNDLNTQTPSVLDIHKVPEPTHAMDFDPPTHANRKTSATEGEKPAEATANRESIRQIFFGADDCETEDHRETELISARPTTARRRPPTIVEKERPGKQSIAERSKGKTPFVFRDEDESKERVVGVDPVKTQGNLFDDDER